MSKRKRIAVALVGIVFALFAFGALVNLTRPEESERGGSSGDVEIERIEMDEEQIIF